jgi:hypothetical protein
VDVLLPLGARVSGRATRDGAGLPSHPVDLIGGSLVGRVNTDANGNFAFDEVPSGSYRLRSVHSGLTLDVPIVVEAPTPLLQNLAFVTPGAIDLQVRFESADGSTIVVNGASVALHDSQSQVQTRTTVNGLASFPIVPAGAFLLRITHPTNASSVTEQSGSLSPGQTLQLSIAIPAFGTLRGGVLFGDGSTAAAGAAVELLEPGVARPPQTTPFQFTTVRAAVELSLRARHPAAGRSHIYKEDRVTIPREGATLDVPIQLPATGTVTVSVKREDDLSGVPGVDVFLQDSFSGSFRFEGTTDANGVAIIPFVPSGAFTVRADTVGEASGSIDFHGESESVELLVSGEASVAGVVYGGDGETKVPAAHIELRSEDGSTLLFETDSAADGSYRFEDAVPAGTSALVRAYLFTDPAKSDERVVTASATGASIAFDPVLPVSVVKGRVLEADGTTPVAGATVEARPYGWLYGGSADTSASGEFALFDQELGLLALSAYDSFGVASHAAGTLTAIGETLVVDLVLPEVGSVEVSVFDENGAPVSAQAVILASASLRSARTVFPDASGIYRFDRVALGTFTVTYDETGRSGSASGRLTDLERNVALSIVLPGYTSLFGELVEGGLPVTPLDEFTPLAVEGRLQESSSGIYRKDDALDSQGEYRVENVPEGTITLTASETVVSAAAALVTADLPEHPVDIERGTAAGFDLELGPSFRVTNDGSLDVLGTMFARARVNGKPYPDLAAAAPDPNDPSHFVVGPVRTGGVEYRRDVYAPAGEKFVRYLEIFENPHGFEVEVTLTLETSLYVLGTSSGDDRIDPADRFFTGFGPGTVVGGSGRLPDFAGSDFDTSFDLTWRKLVVPANGRLVLMHFGIGAEDDLEALALAGSLSQLSHPAALSGLDPALRPSIVNFEVPQ